MKGKFLNVIDEKEHIFCKKNPMTLSITNKRPQNVC